MTTRIIALLLSLLVALPSYAQSPIIWGAGGQAKALNQGGISLQTGQTLNYDGPSNLVKNGRFEDPATSMWATYADAAATVPTDGTGGSPTVTITRTTTASEVIEGRASVAFNKPGLTGLGQGWSYDFSLPAKSTLYSSLVTLSFDYYFSTTSIGSDVVRVYLYDKDTATLITPSFVSCGGGTTPSLTTTTTPCHAELAWVSTTSDDYRLIFHISTVTSSTFTVYLDNVYTGEYRSAVGPALGDWQTFTPTVTNLTLNATGKIDPVGKWRRVGDSMEMSVYFLNGSGGAASGSSLMWRLPSGYTMDTTKLNSTGNGNHKLGTAQVATGTAYQSTMDVLYDSGHLMIGKAGTTNRLAATDITASGSVALQATIPIAEFSGGTAFGENKITYAGHNGTTAICNDMSGAVVPTTTPSGTVDDLDVTSCFPNRQPADRYALEVQICGIGPWSPAPASDVEGLKYDGTNYIGIGWRTTGTDGVYITRGKYRQSSTNAWSGLCAGTRARIIRYKSGMVPYGLASATTPGLVSRELAGSFTSAYSGAISGSATVYYSLVGKTVSLTFPGISGTAASATTVDYSLSNLPSGLAPSADVHVAVPVRDNGSDQASPGVARIQSGATACRVFKAWNSSNFTSAGSMTISGFTVTYAIP